MPTTTTYKDVPEDCIFLDKTEWSMLEYYMPPELRATYSEKGYPRVELPDGPYEYIPIEIAGKFLRAIAGVRPVASKEEVEYGGSTRTRDI